MGFFSYCGLFPHLSPLMLLTLAGWAGRDHTGRLTRPYIPPIMPLRRDNELPVFTPEGTRPVNSNAGDHATRQVPIFNRRQQSRKKSPRPALIS